MQKPPVIPAEAAKTPNRWVLRLHTRLACLAVAVFLLLPSVPVMDASSAFWRSVPQLAWIPGLHKAACPAGAKYVSGASPFVAVCSAIAARGAGLALGAGLVITAVVLLTRRRWFCRYLCPAGLALEGAWRIGLGRKASWWSKCPPLGQYAALLTLAGAIVGYPVLLWMDPLALLSSAFGVGRSGDALAGMLAGAGLTFMIALSLLAGPIWCGRLCPLGGLQDFLAAVRSLFVNKRRAEESPADQPQVGGMPLARRALLAGAVGAGLGLWGCKSARAGVGPLRPPGAAGAGRFTGLCIRCGMCVRACPSKIIQPDLGQSGLAGVLAPRLGFDYGYCNEDCNACTQVCPSGAIARLNLEAKKRHIIGLAKISKPLCLLTQGQECGACIKYCPNDAIRSVWDPKEYESVLVADPVKCNGCGACEMVCPTEPVKAIRVEAIK